MLREVGNCLQVERQKIPQDLCSVWIIFFSIERKQLLKERFCWKTLKPASSNYGKVKFSCISRYIVLVMAVSGGGEGGKKLGPRRKHALYFNLANICKSVHSSVLSVSVPRQIRPRLEM
jgi:hypothetical protein